MPIFGTDIQFVEKEHVSALLVAPIGGKQSVPRRGAALLLEDEIPPKIFVMVDHAAEGLFRDLRVVGAQGGVGIIKFPAKP